MTIKLYILSFCAQQDSDSLLDIISWAVSEFRMEILGWKLCFHHSHHDRCHISYVTLLFFFEPENIQISSSCKRDSSEACQAQSKRLHFYLCWYLLLLNYLICGSSRGLLAARVWVSSRISNLIVHVLFPTYDCCMLWWSVISLNTANSFIPFVGCIFALVCSQNTCFLSIIIHNLLLNKLLLPPKTPKP